MRAFAAALLASSIAGGFACTHDAPRANSANDATAGSKPGVVSRYREMTWAEYYAEVTERVWRRGGTVVWISPPNVRKGKRPAATAAGLR